MFVFSWRKTQNHWPTLLNQPRKDQAGQCLWPHQTGEVVTSSTFHPLNPWIYVAVDRKNMQKHDLGLLYLLLV